MIDHRSCPQSCIKQHRPIHQCLHSARHDLLSGICLSNFIEYLTPFVNLLGKVYLYRTNIRTRHTEWTGRKIIIILLRIVCHPQIDTDRTGNKIRIRITTATTVYRTGIHTSTTTNTDMIGMSKNLTASIIHNDNMIFTPFTWFTIMRSISSHRLSGSRTSQ